ncbi:related to Streptococcus M protein [Cephalotrichum gorgonifer]|uniref:Related to Streptococcus M protein n=1 Tax=Cephalotrichum gorgonifer TaxID=2041049 RepID=A0AAE8MU40_9PEZI|nr:related to Streptococcus M protein [Cephalotrichum gorgonifer]
MGKNPKGSRGNAAGHITDARFASFETDPRFKLPSTKKTKTTIDKRFARMLDGEEFVSATKVDKYGRKLKSKSEAGKKALKSLYRQEEEEAAKADEKNADKESEEEEEEDEDDEEEDSDIDDEEVEEELEAAKSYDPARDGGFSSSEEESDEEEDEEDEDIDAGASMQRFADEQADIEEGEITRRIAVVNMDWDYIKSHDLFAVFSSFLDEKTGGKVEKVSIYPSEFGKERMKREEVEGPPKEIFRKKSKKSKRGESDDESEGSDSDAEDEKIRNELLKEDNDADFDGDALRSYQLDRLRYYYAIMICSDPETAKTIYDATDGTEYLSSSNFIDVRFVPDDVTFDDEPRDECTAVPEGYEPVEFVTNALQSSKVKLTWDVHPEEAERKQSMKKAFGGSRAEIQENDLRAYLASDSEDEGDEGDAKEEARRKMRAALGLGEDEEKGGKDKDGPVGDMEITFTSALLNDSKKAEKEETTIEKYKRKEKERKQARKERAVAKRDVEEGDEIAAGGEDEAQEGEEDLGFNDPFFTTDEPAPVSKSQIRKEERRKKREAKEAEMAETAAEKEKLQRIVDEGEEADGSKNFKHFDMKEIIRAEKDKGKKAKKNKKKGRKGGDEDAAEADGEAGPVMDDRFKDIFESHEYAVDTSNPQFTRTDTMKKLLEEGRKRKSQHGDAEGGEDGERKERKTKKRKDDGEDVDLGGLVASVKQKSKRRGDKAR